MQFCIIYKLLQIYMQSFTKISCQFRIDENSKFSFNFNPRILEIDNSISLYQFVVQIFRTRYINLNIQLRKFIQDPARSLRFRDTLYIRVRWSRRRMRSERGEKTEEDEDCGNGPLPEARVLCPRYSEVSKRRIEMGRRRREGKGPDFCTRRIEI